jgi:hypothetical protein
MKLPRLLVLLAIAFLAFNLACLSPADDWRRTATGWQRMSDWSMSASTFALAADQTLPVARNIGRIDTHPAVLALGELVAALLGLYAFRSSRILPAARHWPALIARSFRASAFG